jgi:hypothetical protein
LKSHFDELVHSVSPPCLLVYSGLSSWRARPEIPLHCVPSHLLHPGLQNHLPHPLRIRYRHHDVHALQHGLQLSHFSSFGTRLPVGCGMQLLSVEARPEPHVLVSSLLEQAVAQTPWMHSPVLLIVLYSIPPLRRLVVVMSRGHREGTSREFDLRVRWAPYHSFSVAAENARTRQTTFEVVPTQSSPRLNVHQRCARHSKGAMIRDRRESAVRYFASASRLLLQRESALCHSGRMSTAPVRSGDSVGQLLAG